MKKYNALCIILIALSLGACQTMDGLVEDMSSLGNQSSNFLSSNNKTLETNCPKIEIVKHLGTLDEFTNNAQSSDDTLISNVALTVAENSCIHNQKSITANVKLAFTSKLGPKGKVRSSDKPFLAYPFFVAITAPNGKIMAKEVFAASMSYVSGENTHTYYETLRPIIPIAKKSRAGKYKILVGFQLDDNQLAYNKAKSKGKTKPSNKGTGQIQPPAMPSAPLQIINE